MLITWFLDAIAEALGKVLVRLFWGALGVEL